MVLYIYFLVSLGLLLQAYAIPLDVAGYIRQGLGAEECALNPNDPASWSQSQAGRFMQSWFDANGTGNWYQAMDQATNKIDGFQSILDCTQLGGSLCRPPFTPCKDYAPPELRLIQVAGTKAHDFFTRAHERLQDNTVENILSIDQIILDFAPAPEAGFNYVDTVSSSFAVAGSIAGIVAKDTPAGAVFGLIGGVINLAKAAKPPQPPEYDPARLRAAVSSQLKDTFVSAGRMLEGFNSKLFGGTFDIDLGQLVSQLQSDGILDLSPVAGLDPITQIFSTGAFLAPPAMSELEQTLAVSLARVKQSLVAGILRANNYYIFIDTTADGQSACSTTTGSRTINGECMIISKRVNPSAVAPRDTIPVDREILLRLDDPNAGYNIDPVVLYQNALDCNGGGRDNQESSGGDSLPKCFFSLPILRVNGDHVCTLIPEDYASAPGYAAGLQLTAANCGGLFS